MSRTATGTVTASAAAAPTRTRAAAGRPAAGRSSRVTRCATSPASSGSLMASAPDGARQPPAAPTRSSAVASSRAGRLAARPVVGVHLDQQRHGLVRGPGRLAPAEGGQQGDEREQHQVVALAYVGALVGQHGGQLGGVQQVQGARADHDGRAQPGQAVGRRGRVVHDQRPRHLGVAVGQQAEQHALALPGPQNRGGRRHQHVDQQGQQHQAGAQADQPGRGERADRRQGAGVLQSAGPAGSARRSPPPSPRPAVPRPIRVPTVARPQPSPMRLPQHDGRRGRPARPARRRPAGPMPGRSPPPSQPVRKRRSWPLSSSGDPRRAPPGPRCSARASAPDTLRTKRASAA